MNKRGPLRGLSSRTMVVRLAQQAYTMGSRLPPPSRRQLTLFISSHLVCIETFALNHTQVLLATCGHLGRVSMQKIRLWLNPPWPCIPCYHSSTQTNEVMFLLGRHGFRQNSAGCLATGYRKKIIKLH